MVILAQNFLENNNQSLYKNHPQNISENEIIPWSCCQVYYITDSYLSKFLSVFTKIPFSTTVILYMNWFYHGKLLLITDSKNIYKIVFGLILEDYRLSKSDNGKVY